jgi:hypothetical protein
VRLIDHLERELARLSKVRHPEGPDGDAYLAGCATAVRDLIDALGSHDEPVAAIAAVARRPRQAPSDVKEKSWRAGHTDTLRLLGARSKNADLRPIDWVAMR